MSKIDPSLFDTDVNGNKEDCPQCGSELVIKNSKKGLFLGCKSYPDCDYIHPINQKETSEIKILEASLCPECDKPLAIKNGRYGMFIGCTGYPQCNYIVHEDVQPSDNAINCPKCKKGLLTKRNNKYGKVFYSCDTYPTCKYSVNKEPVANECPKCGWSIMLKKDKSVKSVLQCPQKTCQYKVEVEND